MDGGVGRIVRTVERLGLARRTFIFFCSDNGAVRPGSNGPLAGWKGTLWEGGHRVPAIAYWPGKIRPGTVTDQTAMTMDLLPTMAAVAGAPLPSGLTPDGVDLSPVLERGGKLPERTLFWRAGRQKAARKGAWKLLVNPRRGRQRRQAGPARVHLYNLAEDAGERKDLASAERKRVKGLRAELVAWEQTVSVNVTRQA